MIEVYIIHKTEEKIEAQNILKNINTNNDFMGFCIPNRGINFRGKKSKQINRIEKTVKIWKDKEREDRINIIKQKYQR